MSNESFEREFQDFLADEKSRLAELYRKLPQAEPEARLDSAIRAMAHRALNPQLVATPQPHARRQTARWLPALGAAAGIVLAAGIAFRLGPSMRSDRSETGAPASDVVSVRALDAPATAPPPLSPAPPPPAPAASGSTGMARADAGNAPAAPAAAPGERSKSAIEQAPAALPATEGSADALTTGAGGAIEKNQEKPLASPRPFPEAAQRRSRSEEMDAVERKQMMAKGAWQNLHDQDSNQGTAAKTKPDPGTRDGAPSLTSGVAPATHNEPAARSAAPPAEAFATRPIANAAPEQPAQPPAGIVAGAAELQPNARAASPQSNTPVGGDNRSDQEKRPETAPTSQGPNAAKTVQTESALADRGTSLPPQNPSVPLKKENHGIAHSSDPNARLYPEHWLKNIYTMLRERRRDEALRSLAEFRRLYPDYHLPDDLRDLK